MIDKKNAMITDNVTVRELFDVITVWLLYLHGVF